MVGLGYYFDISLLIVAFLFHAEGSSQAKPKRQIYREQVLPSSGGKIPDGAFATDRLALNRLNKAGIAIPDGVLLEHRHVYSHPHSTQHDPEDEDSLVKIIQKPEDRYVPPEGIYHHEKPLTVPSTYIIRKPTHTTNIRTPSQQMPLHEFLAAKEVGLDYGLYPTALPKEVTGVPYGPYPTPFFPQSGWRPLRPEHVIPGPAYFRQYVSTAGQAPYQEVKQPVGYYPVTVPLELPNKSVQKIAYHKGSPIKYTHAEDVHKVVNWPYLLREYTRLEDEINDHNAVDQGSYAYNAQHSLFFTPEVVPPLESYYYGAKDRYARKSKELSFAEHTSDTSVNRPKSKDARTVIKLRCTVGSENAVDGHDAKCRLRY